jgi:hypothetical protein
VDIRARDSKLTSLKRRLTEETAIPAIAGRSAGVGAIRSTGGRPPEPEGDLLFIDEDRVTGLLEQSRGRRPPEKGRRPYYLILSELERKLILLALRQSRWKIKPAAELLGINHLSLRSKLLVMLRLFLEEADGDVGRACRNRGIPKKFFVSKLHLIESR